MAHFAELNDSNVVLRVVVIADSDCLDSEDKESEAVGIAFCEGLFGSGTWKQTSYNGNIRSTYANPGSTYNPSKDKFIPTSPYPSWVLNSDDNWESPLGDPPEVDNYSWDESAYQADNTKGWQKDDFT
tara:strand:+ start:1404 stop:1787 length:384 start_codon:yes stop_codon:yes gene_type:complete